MQRRILAAALGASLLLAAACGDERAADVTTSSVAVDTTVAADTTVGADSTVSVDSSVNASTTVAGSSGTIAVPGDFDTIQAAVDAAAPGALILIGPGTYNEAVNVTTDNLTIRGLDRNEVVLDGQLELDNGIRILGASGVTVENLTAMNYTRNGFFWTGVDGYRGAYLTAYRTGDYGVYVFDSMNGDLEHIYAAGSPDAGVYIGECYPCNAVIDDAVSEHNGLGYSGTNSGGNLLIVNSTFRYNRAGVVPNSGSYELCYPEPFLEEDPNDSVPLPEEWSLTCAESKLVPPQDPGGGILWDSMQNRVIGNVLENNRVADLLVASAGTDVSSLGHCFTGNVYTTTAPNNLEVLAPCDATGSGDGSDGEYNVAAWLGETHPPSVAWQTAPLPALEQQVSMPDAATAPAHPATDVSKQIDLAAISVPAKPA